MATDEDIREIQERVGLLQHRPVEIVLLRRSAQIPVGLAVSTASSGLVVRPHGDQEIVGQNLDGAETSELAVITEDPPDSSQRLRWWRRVFRKRLPVVVDGGGLALVAGTMGTAAAIPGTQGVLIGVGGAVLSTVCARVMTRMSSPGSEAP